MGNDKRFEVEAIPESILEGKNKDWGNVKTVEWLEELTNFEQSRLSPVPEVGVHPRILCSPEDLPNIQRRINETETGRILIANLRKQNNETILKPNSWENKVYIALQQKNINKITDLLENPVYSYPTGHYQPHILYGLVREAFDAWITGHSGRGQAVAAAICGYALYLEPSIREYRQSTFKDHAARWGSWHALGSYELFGFQHLGYAYDFAYNFMSPDQRKIVRSVISNITSGAISYGMDLPVHWRNWNWMNCGNCFVLLALSIEGEEGYDARVYQRAVEVMTDYLTYGYSAKGSSTESVGYTAFGWVWGAPAMIAMARRGDNLFLHPHFNHFISWLIHTMQPYGHEWISRGDAGDRGPGPHFVQMLKYFFPLDPDINLLWQNGMFELGIDQRKEQIHLIETILWADDGSEIITEQSVEHQQKRELTFFDQERGSLITRDNWSKDATVLQFECRTDTLTPAHEHADRGHFSLTALGVNWAGDGFRSVETKYHSCVLIDGKGQGYFPPPGQWINHVNTELGTLGICNAKYAYDWFWPKTIAASSSIEDSQFNYDRWKSFKEEVESYYKIYNNVPKELEDTPHIVEHFKGYTELGARVWDEDGWPIRTEHNPVQYAYRTAGLIRGRQQPYVLIVDDIRKDNKEHLYEWTMMTGLDVDVNIISKSEIHLYSREHSNGSSPQNGDPMLLVRVLDLGIPEQEKNYDTVPSIRLETFEKRDTYNNTHPLYKQDGAGSYGLDRRLIIPSRSIEPRFKVLLIPYRYGETLPEISFDPQTQQAILNWGNNSDTFNFIKQDNGKTSVELYRNNQCILSSEMKLEKN